MTNCATGGRGEGQVTS